MSYFSRTSSTAPPAANQPMNVQNDVEIPNAPPDSVSCMQFSSQADLLAVGSWDNKVRLYEVAPNGQAQGKAMYEHQGPVLSVCWNKAGDTVYSGGADNAARSYNLATGQTAQVAQHDGPIKAARWIDMPNMNTGILATGSWDKTVKYWDLRTPTPVASIPLPERCYSLDAVFPLMVVACAERNGEKNVMIYDLNKPTETFKVVKSPLTFQTRVITCFPRGDGFALGSIEGRVALQYIDDKHADRNFSFRCHRKSDKPGATASKDQNIVYAVNDINFHPVYGTFSTCGSDGTINYWDGEARTRLKVLDPANGSISATCFNRNGTMQAYALSYDWHKGHSGMTPGVSNKIMLHPCKDEEVKKKSK